jgi:hypothetical protein
MKIQVDFWEPNEHYKSVVVRTEDWDDTKENIFKQFYEENNRLRYCNGSYFKFKDETIQKEYIEWYKSLDYNTTFNMYYGNGVVD